MRFLAEDLITSRYLVEDALSLHDEVSPFFTAIVCVCWARHACQAVEAFVRRVALCRCRLYQKEKATCVLKDLQFIMRSVLLNQSSCVVSCCFRSTRHVLRNWKLCTRFGCRRLGGFATSPCQPEKTTQKCFASCRFFHNKEKRSTKANSFLCPGWFREIN